MRYLVMTLVTLFLCLSSPFEAFADDGERLSALLDSFSPLPPRPDVEKPGYRGVLFQFWHTLRDLDERRESLDPKSKRYYYLTHPELAPDVERQIQVVKMAYENLLEHYQIIFDSYQPDDENRRFYINDVDRILNQIRGRAFPYELWPNEIIDAKKAADLALRLVSTNYAYSELIVVTRRLNIDVRRAGLDFLGLTVQFARDHKPLEGLFDLTSHSQRGRSFLEITMDYYFNQYVALIQDIADLTEAKLSPSSREPYDREFYPQEQKLHKYTLTIELLINKLYSVLMHSNDLVLNRIADANTMKDLERIARSLGKGMVETMEAIDQYNADPRSSRPEPKGDVLLFGDAKTELDYLFNHRSARRSPFPAMTLFSLDHISPHNKRSLTDVYKEVVTSQYVVAIGALMAKVAEIDEGRGSRMDRLRQEIGFRKAQLLAMTGIRKKAPDGRQLVVTNKPKKLAPSTSQIIRRRQFNQLNSSDLTALEDRLWRPFFEEVSILKWNQPKADAQILPLHRLIGNGTTKINAPVVPTEESALLESSERKSQSPKVQPAVYLPGEHDHFDFAKGQLNVAPVLCRELFKIN